MWQYISLFCPPDECLTGTDPVFQVSEKSPDLKKTGKPPRSQSSVKEVSLPVNSSNTWNRPRCGVPDYPAQKEVHYRVRNRQRRFVLYGGRLDRTDLTYRYLKRIIITIHTHHSVRTIGDWISILAHLRKLLNFQPILTSCLSTRWRSDGQVISLLEVSVYFLLPALHQGYLGIFSCERALQI